MDNGGSILWILLIVGLIFSYSIAMNSIYVEGSSNLDNKDQLTQAVVYDLKKKDLIKEKIDLKVIQKSLLSELSSVKSSAEKYMLEEQLRGIRLQEERQKKLEERAKLEELRMQEELRQKSLELNRRRSRAS